METIAFIHIYNPTKINNNHIQLIKVNHNNNKIFVETFKMVIANMVKIADFNTQCKILKLVHKNRTNYPSNSVRTLLKTENARFKIAQMSIDGPNEVTYI